MATNGGVDSHLHLTNLLFGQSTFLGDLVCVDGKKTSEKLVDFVIAAHNKV